MLNCDRGFSVLELLISMVAGLMVLAGALSLFSTVLATSNTNLMLSRLNQEVQTVADLISRDLQKTGYHPKAATELAQNSPLAQDSAVHYAFSLTDDIYSHSSGLHCIRLKYWDATLPSGDEPTVRIYSYHSGTKKLTLYSVHAPPNNAALSTLCGSGSQLISSQEIKIEQLVFTPISSAPSSSGASVHMAMTAVHARRPSLTMSLERQVYLRNEGRSP